MGKTANITIVTDMPFWKKGSGGLMRLNNMIKYLSKNFELNIVFLGVYSQDDKNVIKKDYRLNFFYYRNPFNFTLSGNSKFDPLFFPITIFYLLLSRLSATKSLRRDKKYFAKKALTTLKPDYIIFERLRLAHILDNGFNQKVSGKTFIDTHDVLSERSRLVNSSKSITLNQEKKALNLFDKVIAINKRDEKAFLKMGIEESKVITVGHANEISRLEENFGKTVRLGYFAKNNTQNYEAIHDFIINSWNNIPQKNLNIKLLLAGSLSVERGSDIAKLGEGIENIGFVDDLKELYQKVDIILNPIRTGTGLKIKNVEALCYGKPLITTTVGAQGLEDGIDMAFLVCDNWSDTTISVLSLASNANERKHLSMKAIRYANQNFSEEKIYQPLVNELIK